MIHLSPSFPQGSRSKLRASTVSYLTPVNSGDAEKATVTSKVIICFQKTPLLPERLPLTSDLILRYFTQTVFFSLLTFFHIT